MKRRKFIINTGIGIAGIALLKGNNMAVAQNMFPLQHASPEDSLIKINPSDNGKALVNPNAGVAPCYPGGFACFTIKDEKGGIVSVLTDEKFNMDELQVSEPNRAISKQIVSTFTIAPTFNDPLKAFFRGVKHGKYDLYVSVGKKDGTPVFELPYNESDGNKRYKIGKIELLDREGFID